MTKKYSVTAVYRRLLSYVWPHKWLFAISILGFAMFASSAPMLAHLMGMVEETLRQPTDQQIMLLIASLLGIYTFRGIGTFLGKYFTARVGREVVHSLRLGLFTQMLRLPSRYYDGESSGRLISRVIFDVEQVNGAATKALTTAIQEGITVILLMGYLIWLDASLTLIFLFLVPAIGAAVALASGYFRKYSKRIQRSMGGVTQVTNETIKAYREVRAFGATTFEEQRFLKVSNENRKQVLKFALTNAINVPLTQQIVALGLAIMIYLMFQRVAGDSMTGAEFLQFITAASLIAKPIRALTNINAEIQKGVAAAESVFTILDAEREDDCGKQSVDRVQGHLNFNQVNFTYAGSESKALTDIQLSIKAGEMIALVGKSGSGKSTLVSLLPRFYDHDDGQILLDDIPINDLTLSSLRDQIAIVSQTVTLFNASIRDNIAYGGLQQCSDEAIEQAARAANIMEFVDQLPDGLDTMVGESGILLSGGQRQRLAIARALLKDAPILVLDEATSALDTESERAIQDALNEVMKGRTTLVVAHRLSTIEQADRIIVMEKGKIIEQGSHQQLLEQQGAYAKLHALQFSE